MQSAGDPRNEIEELRRQLNAKDALLAERDAELAAAKAGLVAKTLEAEKLKFELARLKRMSFGASSERIEREIAQLELKLEEIETAAIRTAGSR
jgi:chromosome segregation ATPase